MPLRRTFIRHANAAPGEADLYRPLSEKGLAQAKARAETLKNFRFGVVFSSDATRCVKTAGPFMEGPKIVRIFTHGAFSLPARDEKWAFEIRKAFDALGYTSIGTYFARGKSVQDALERYGRRAIEQMAYNINDVVTLEKVHHGIFGHAVLLQAIALEMIKRRGISADKEKIAELMNLNLGEAQGFTLVTDTESGVVTDIEFHVEELALAAV